MSNSSIDYGNMVSEAVRAIDRRDERLAALYSYNILDTPPEKAFDDIAKAASAFCGVPIALVSLVDHDRQWFKACIGVDASQTPIDQAVCAITIRQSEPLVIPDLTLDRRTAQNPLVTDDPRIRFYAGVPLITKAGHALGTLCVIDRVPHPQGITDDQRRGLIALAGQVTQLIEMRRAVEERDATIVTYLRLSDEANARAQVSDEARDMAEARDQRSMAAQEAGRIGTFELDVHTDIAVVSPEFCRIFGLPEQETYVFEAVAAHIVQEDFATHSARENRRDGSAALDVEYRIRRVSDGNLRWVARRARFIRENGKVVRMFGTIHDITERRLDIQRIAALLELGDGLRKLDSVAEAVSLAAKILGRELEVSRAGYAAINRANVSFNIEHGWTAGSVASLAGTHPVSSFTRTVERLASGQTMAITDVRKVQWLADEWDAFQRIGARAVINVPIIIRQELVGVFFVHDGQARVWTKKEVEFLQSVADRTYAVVAQFEAEAQRNLLNLELSHRMKNMLTMVQAIATQTLKGVAERGAVTSFNQRLIALSAAHDILVKDHWAAAPVDGVVENVLNALGVADRVHAHGPLTTFGPRTTLALSLLLHELTTNAIKYGSLSVGGGHVSLAWDVEGEGAASIFTMHWREIDGPAVSEPVRKGFGSRLINMGLLGTGGVAMRYLASGFEADFFVSMDRANAE